MSRRNSSDYWRERALQRETEAFTQGDQLLSQVYNEYQKAQRNIQKAISEWYLRYASENGLSYDEAVRLLNKREAQEWLADIGTYVDNLNAVKAVDPARAAILKSELDALSYNSRITRLMSLEGQINGILNGLFDKVVIQSRAQLTDIFSQSYYKKTFDLQQRVGFFSQIAKIDESMIEDVLTYPWSGANFSDRLWRNKQALLFHARETITQGLIAGDSIPEMSKQLAGRVGQSYKNAERLIRTETGHFHNEATKKAYEAAGVDKYEFMATLDERTCPICGPLDGQKFPLKDAEEGVNYPEMHPYCRCTTIEFDLEDAQDWAASGEKMPENMTYEEWLKKQEETDGKGWKEKRRRDIVNINIQASNGINVKSASKHCMQRALERGIQQSDIKDALTNPLKVNEVIEDSHVRRSQRFIGERATVNVNPDTGVIATVWKTGKKTRNKFKKERGVPNE